MRFRCLLKHRVLHYDPVQAAKIIYSCCALHNLLLRNNVNLEIEEPTEDVLQENEAVNNVEGLV